MTRTPVNNDTSSDGTAGRGQALATLVALSMQPQLFASRVSSPLGQRCEETNAALNGERESRVAVATNGDGMPPTATQTTSGCVLLSLLLPALLLPFTGISAAAEGGGNTIGMSTNRRKASLLLRYAAALRRLVVVVVVVLLRLIADRQLETAALVVLLLLLLLLLRLNGTTYTVKGTSISGLVLCSERRTADDAAAPAARTAVDEKSYEKDCRPAAGAG